MGTYKCREFLSLILCVIGINKVCSQPTTRLQLEWDLREWMFGNNYEVQTRPDTLVNIQISLTLLTLNYLDIKEQKLSITGYFQFVWDDVRLDWSGNASYSTIPFIFSTEKDIWTPPLILENAIDGIDVISTPNNPIKIRKKGKVAWLPASIFTTSCESSVTYWPLDTQTCNIILSTWGYTATEVLLGFDNILDEKIATSFYQENGEWELLEKSYAASIVERQRQDFSRLTFTIKLRRRPLFHMLNTLFPVVLMGFLTVAIFKLTPESGERVGLALTILLAYAVYLGLISDYVPQTSLSASVLSTYLASILLLQTVAVFLTVIYLDIYLTSEDIPVPQWLQSMTTSCLTKLVCIKCNKKQAKVEPSVEDSAEKDNKKSIPANDIWDLEGEEIYEISEHDTTEIKRRNFGVVQIQYGWKEIALYLDKVTMYIYLMLVTVMTFSLTIVMAQHYISSY